MPPFEEKVKAGFEAAADRMKGFEMDMDEIKSRVGELTTWLEKLGQNVKARMFDAIIAPDNPRSFWGSASQAKDFGDLILHVLGRKSLSTAVGAEGGYLVAEELTSKIIQKLGVYGKFRKYATLLPMLGPAASVPRITADLTVYCPGEGNDIDLDDPTFDQVKLLVKKLACLCKVSSEISEDAVIGIGEIVGISIARSMAKKEDAIGFVGDGTAEYFSMTGICGALRAVHATIGNIKGLVVGSGNVYTELTLDDFHKVVGILPEDVDENAVWFMNKKFYYETVWKLAESAGNANVFDILTDRKGRFLLGYPVEFVSAMPSIAANSQICALLGDLSIGAYLGERRQLTIEQSRDAYFGADQVGIKGTERISINAFGVGDTTEAGAIVGLITAAA